MGYQKLGLTTGHRKAMLRNLVTSLFREERINTTEARAKEVKSIAEKLVTAAKKGDLAARRRALAYIYEEDVVRKLFSTIAPKYADRQGGYTRIIKTGYRRGDAAKMVILELV
ncbi:MAG: 50S ribosomal protein L17 [Pelotomaculum thermopropionicum]|uniref:Large ribosomal subunit protein bL17 n=1 Tax=Pelotomaculum thermopropionicum TaxID=110500 RepID=A0A101HUQ9_9FIRM|nr:MAG: 50S ribosomal protein L17 [Pelotomaculum thermopropionicum]